jgi:hypothetical protein
MVDVFEALRSAAMHFGIPKLAKLMGAPVGVLYNKCNPNTERNIFTLSDFIQISNITGSSVPMQALSHQMGGVFYPLPDMSDKSDSALLDIINNVHSEGGDVHRELSLALMDGKITEEEFVAINKEIQEWLAAILELRARVKFMVVLDDA